jgi:hypothetical protein
MQEEALERRERDVVLDRVTRERAQAAVARDEGDAGANRPLGAARRERCTRDGDLARHRRDDATDG